MRSKVHIILGLILAVVAEKVAAIELLGNSSLNCSSNCISCANSTYCYSCESRYYLAFRMCYSCPYSCNSCGSSGYCYSCQANYILKNGDCEYDKGWGPLAIIIALLVLFFACLVCIIVRCKPKSSSGQQLIGEENYAAAHSIDGAPGFAQPYPQQYSQPYYNMNAGYQAPKANPFAE